MPDSSTWQLALMRCRLSALERKTEQPHADTNRLLAECIRELKSTFDFLETAGERLGRAHADLKVVQEQVRHEQSRFKALVELMPDAFVITDLSGVILEVNAAAGHLLNLSPRALSGRPLHVFLNRDRVEFLDFIKALPDAVEPAQRELRLRPRERHFVTVLARLGTVRDAEGRPVALHWILSPAAGAQPDAALNDETSLANVEGMSNTRRLSQA